MFKRILLPLDLSPRHDAALRIAAELANQSQGKVFLFHVIETIPGLAQEEDRDFYAKLERSAAAHLQRYRKTLEQKGVSVRAVSVVGHRVSDTAGHAKKIRADLITLTVPAFDAERPTGGLGSMSWKFALLAP